MKLILLVGFLLSASTAYPQTSIFNIPATDTLEKGKTYIEADLFTHFGPAPAGFYQYGTTVVRGLSESVDVGVNVFALHSDGETGVELQPNIKWNFYKNKKGIAASAGTILLVPINDAAGSRTSALIYGNASKAFKGGEGTRLTAGAYGVARTEAGFGSRTGVMFGVEHPVTEKLYFVADWMSGNNRFGYGSAGVYYQLDDRQGVTVGYSIGNAGRGNNYLTAVYAVTF